MLEPCAWTAKFWSAATCRRFRRLADLSARQNRVQRFGSVPHAGPFDGDKSPAQSGENSPHSISRRASLNHKLPVVTGDHANARLMMLVRNRALDARQGGLIEGKFLNAPKPGC
jgi:hypothetical protein